MKKGAGRSATFLVTARKNDRLESRSYKTLVFINLLLWRKTMLRKRSRFEPSWILAAVSMLAIGPAASAQSLWKLYDVRDLSGLVSPSGHTAQSTANRGRRLALYEPIDSSSRRTAAPAPTDGDGIDALMSRLCDTLGMSRKRLFDGVYGVEGDADQHARVLGMLEEIRAMFDERYAVEIAWFTTPSEGAPAIGDAVVFPDAGGHRHRIVVTRRTPTPLIRVTETTFVSDIQAIVATEAVAFDPEVTAVADGLRLSILVGAGKQTKSATGIRIAGSLNHVTLDRQSTRISGQGAAPAVGVSTMGIDLPVVAVRSIRSDLFIDYGRLTVLGVVDGFDVGQAIIIAASVRRLGD